MDPLKNIEKLLRDGNKRIEELEKKTKNRTLSLPGAPAKEEREYSIVNAIRASATGNWDGAEYEKEISDNARKDLQKRDLSYLTTPGSVIVPEQYVPQMIEQIKASAVVLQAGVTQMNGLTTTPLRIPKKTGNVTTYYRTEGSDLTESDINLDDIELTPKLLSAMTVQPREFLAWSNPAAETILRQDISEEIALTIDKQLLEGDGASDNPTGLLYTANVPSVDVGDVDVDKLNDILYSLESNNTAKGRLAWIMNPRTFNQIRKLRDDSGGAGTGQYLVQPDVTAGSRYSLLGFPVYVTTQASMTLNTAGDESSIFFGDWSQLLHATWIPGLEIMASMEAEGFFRANKLGIRALIAHDVGCRHPEAFCIGDGVNA